MALKFKFGAIYRLQSYCSLTQAVQNLVITKYASADLFFTTETNLIKTLKSLIKIFTNPQIDFLFMAINRSL